MDDGKKVYEFVRFDNYWRGVATGATNKGLAYVISKQTLDKLKSSHGYMVVYAHLGKNDDCSQWIAYETQEALRNLANEYETGNIYVTTTSKLLNYYINHKHINWSYKNKKDEIIIYVHAVNDPVFGTFLPTTQNLQGITFYVPDGKKITLFIGDDELKSVQLNPPDYTGRKSVSIPLSFLTYPTANE